jgi:hypothetical protein
LIARSKTKKTREKPDLFRGVRETQGEFRPLRFFLTCGAVFFKSCENASFNRRMEQFFLICIVLTAMGVVGIALMIYLRAIDAEIPESGKASPNWGVTNRYIAFLLAEILLVTTFTSVVLGLTYYLLFPRLTGPQAYLAYQFGSAFTVVIWPAMALFWVVIFAALSRDPTKRAREIASKIVETGSEDMLFLSSFRGALPIAFAQRMTTGRVHCVDPWSTNKLKMKHEWLVENAKRSSVTSQRLIVDWGDARDLFHIASQSFDVIVISFGMDFLYDPEDFDFIFNSLARILKPNGTITLIHTYFFVDAFHKRLIRHSPFVRIDQKCEFLFPVGRVISQFQLPHDDSFPIAVEIPLEPFQAIPDMKYNLKWIPYSIVSVLLFVGLCVGLVFAWPYVGFIPASLSPTDYNSIGSIFTGALVFLPIGLIETSKAIRSYLASKSFDDRFADSSTAIQRAADLQKPSVVQASIKLAVFWILSLIGSTILNIVFWFPSLVFDLFIQSKIDADKWSTLIQFANTMISILIFVITNAITTRIQTWRRLQRKKKLNTELRTPSRIEQESLLNRN